MLKKTIAMALMVTMLSLSAQVAVGDVRVIKTSDGESRVELINYLLTEGYTEEEADNLIPGIPEEQVNKVSSETNSSKRGGETDTLTTALAGIGLVVVLIWASAYSEKDEDA